jgi:hypothetical protein
MQRAFKRQGKRATARGGERGRGLAFSPVLFAGAPGASGCVVHAQAVCCELCVMTQVPAVRALFLLDVGKQT